MSRPSPLQSLQRMTRRPLLKALPSDETMAAIPLAAALNGDVGQPKLGDLSLKHSDSVVKIATATSSRLGRGACGFISFRKQAGDHWDHIMPPGGKTKIRRRRPPLRLGQQYGYRSREGAAVSTGQWQRGGDMIQVLAGGLGQENIQTNIEAPGTAVVPPVRSRPKMPPGWLLEQSSNLPPLPPRPVYPFVAVIGQVMRGSERYKRVFA